MAIRTKQKMFLQASEADVNRDRANEMKAYFKRNRNSVSARTMLEDMPRELRAWVTEGWEDLSRLAGARDSIPKKLRLL